MVFTFHQCFVFPRKRPNPLLMDNAPESSKGFFNGSGWMTGEVFKDYLNHFIEFVKPSTATPVLLILDGHASHTKNLDVIDLASSNGVIMLSLPPHTTHRLQPLDVGFYKPLQTYYDRYIERWLKSHPGSVFTEYQVAQAFNKEAYGKAAMVEVATNTFRKCGSTQTFSQQLTTHLQLQLTVRRKFVKFACQHVKNTKNMTCVWCAHKRCQKWSA